MLQQVNGLWCINKQLDDLKQEIRAAGGAKQISRKKGAKANTKQRIACNVDKN
jgi:hypothetical protein